MSWYAPHYYWTRREVRRACDDSKGKPAGLPERVLNHLDGEAPTASVYRTYEVLAAVRAVSYEVVAESVHRALLKGRGLSTTPSEHARRGYAPSLYRMTE